ncbi:MAG: LysR family transcriptional regulator [Polyangiales bacterium]
MAPNPAIDLNDLAVFVRVVDGNGFTAAAKALAVPKSSVSRAVSRLEEALGVRLLQRTTRKVTITDAGRALHARVREQVAALSDATNEVADSGKVAQGVIRVTAPVDLGIAFLADAVARFVERHPHVRIELSLTGRLVDMVEEGFDVAIRASRMVDSSLVGRKLGTSALGLFASKKYLERHGKPTKISDLGSHACVLFRTKSGSITWTLSGPGGDEDVDVHGPISADDMLFVERAIAADGGIGLLPLFHRGAELVRVLPHHSVKMAPIYMLTPSKRHEPARVTLFREFLIDHLARTRWGS